MLQRRRKGCHDSEYMRKQKEPTSGSLRETRIHAGTREARMRTRGLHRDTASHGGRETQSSRATTSATDASGNVAGIETKTTHSKGK